MAETVQEYKQRLFQHLGDQNPLKVQAATPARLERLVKGATGARLARRPASGKWSVKEIVMHLADVEMVIGYRMRSILGEPNTEIMPFDQDRWLAAMRYDKRSMGDALEGFRAMRKFNLGLLSKLTPTEWKLAGVHRERGRESIEHIVRMMAGHDLNHLAQVKAIVDAKPARR